MEAIKSLCPKKENNKLSFILPWTTLAESSLQQLTGDIANPPKRQHIGQNISKEQEMKWIWYVKYVKFSPSRHHLMNWFSQWSAAVFLICFTFFFLDKLNWTNYWKPACEHSISTRFPLLRQLCNKFSKLLELNGYSSIVAKIRAIYICQTHFVWPPHFCFSFTYLLILKSQSEYKFSRLDTNVDVG